MRPHEVLAKTSLSPSLTPQLKPSAGLKTISSPTTGPKGLAPLTTLVTTTSVTQG